MLHALLLDYMPMVTYHGRGNQLAPWVNSTLTATELDKALKNHITKIMNHFAGKLHAVDVIVRSSAFQLGASTDLKS